MTLAALPRRLAALCLDALRFGEKELGRPLSGMSVVAACSGGCDSTALMRWLGLWSEKQRIRVIGAHLNHGLRPCAKAEKAFVCGLCESLEMTVECGHVDVKALSFKSGAGLEEAGRAARYDFLESVRQKYRAELIITAHQLDDLAEDQVLRLVRGAGWPALAGMPAYDPDRRLLRPLLLTPKAELAALLRHLGQPWREDETNQDPDTGLRNRVRLGILPRLTDENPGFLRATARLWEQGRADEAFWDGQCASMLEESGDGSVRLPLPGLREHPRALRLRLCKAALERLGPGQPLADSLFALDRSVMDRRTGATFRFPGGKRAAVERNGVRFFLEKDQDS